LQLTPGEVARIGGEAGGEADGWAGAA